MSTATLSGQSPSAQRRPMTREERRVIFASSLGTVFEWYDFYLYGSLAAIIAQHFFSGGQSHRGLHLRAAGLRGGLRTVRPFGALVFGRLGDLVGRKVHLPDHHRHHGPVDLPGRRAASYASIGIAAPAILIILRLLQGLALGGEYGGAATYVAEHARMAAAASTPAGSRPPRRWACSCRCW